VYERALTLVVLIIAVVCFPTKSDDGRLTSIVAASASPTAPTACAFPTAVAATLEETAWRLFVAAICPANKSQVVWETWIEQGQLYPASGAGARGALKLPAARLHGSPLARARMARLGAISLDLVPSTQCNVMNGPPPNVKANSTICEEARLNPAAQKFVSDNGYQVRPAQTKAAQKGTDIEFPESAIEVKVDWIPATDFDTPFDCTNPPTGIHVEMIDGTCYAMAGIHISSKLLKDWIWATFEPQSMLTNPLRCITFGPCNDAWGGNPATNNGGAGGFTSQTPALTDLMKQANLSPDKTTVVHLEDYKQNTIITNITDPDGKFSKFHGQMTLIS
jgi:hypothetical protein